jgi:hypothetical protein
MKTRTKTTMLVGTICFSGSFATGATPGEIKAGERVKITERIVSLVSGTPKLRVVTKDGRWAWVSSNCVK